MKAIELFAGAGGLSLAIQKAGFDILSLVEIDKNCCHTLRHNFPNHNVIENDIYNVDLSTYKDEKIDLLAGGIPCQAFSFVGLKKGLEDKRGRLFFSFRDNLKILQPKVFLIENVKGLFYHNQKKTFESIKKELENTGYTIYYKICNTVYYNVPQNRERIIIVGVRNDIKTPFYFPKENSKIITVKEALENVPFSLGAEYSESKKEILKLVPEGGNWKDLPEDIAKKYLGKAYYSGGGKTGIAKRLCWNKPSPTLLCSPMQKVTERCHPSETRPLTIKEYARLQTFPDSYDFIGGMLSQYSQIGNAVPVEFGYAITKSIYDFLQNINFDNSNINK